MLIIFLLSSLQARSQTDLPDIPDLIRVTVDTSDNGVLIQWEPSTDTDIEVYRIYKMRPDLSFEQVDEVDGATYEYKHLNTGTKNLAYSVTAVDSAIPPNESPFRDNIHRAVSLSAEFEPCAPANLLTWTGYEGWAGQISGYKVFGAAAGEALQMLSFVNASTLSYTHEGIRTGTSYAYLIETIHANGLNSLSTIDSVEAFYPDPPAYMSVDFVSVLDQNTVELQFTADVSGPVKDFRLVKRTNPGSPFTEVQTFRDESQSTRLVQDQFPTSSLRYEYRVQAIYQPPGCETPLILSESNSGTSVLLESSLENQTVMLSWTPYVSYNTGLSGYTIQRRSGSGAFFDIQTIDPGSTEWSEALSSALNGFQPGELQYRVLAISLPQAQGQNGISVSNIATVRVETSLRVPSAFTPGSNDMNFEFKPLMDFAPREYLMIIMDRGGRKMFETKDPGEGWKGRFQGGEFVNEGVYVYYLQYTDYTGLFKTHTGNVTVLYP